MMDKWIKQLFCKHELITKMDIVRFTQDKDGSHTMDAYYYTKCKKCYKFFNNEIVKDTKQ